MKIDIYKPVVLFLLPAVLAGCSGEREPFPQGGKAGLRIENCSSRGGTDGNSVLVKDFGMVLLDDTGGGYAGAVNPLHVTYGEGWIFPEVTLTETPCRLFAFSPFAAIPGKELPLDLVPQTDYLASGEIRLDWQNRSADIGMEHLLCLLEFTIDGSSACTLSVEGVPTGGTYDLAGGKLSAGWEKGTVPSEGNKVLLLPGKAGNNRVVIRFQENTYGWLLPAVTLEAGKRYGYALSLGKEGVLILSGVNVRPWQEGEDYTGTIKPNE